MRKPPRPNAAYKLLVHLLYGQFDYIARLPGGVTKLTQIKRLARLLGTRSPKIRSWLEWLEEHGYLESLVIHSDRRSASFRIREPSYVLSNSAPTTSNNNS